MEKMYILIFTCFNVRAIHLELLNEMSSHSVVLTMVRFLMYMGCIPIYEDH